MIRFSPASTHLPDDGVFSNVVIAGVLLVSMLCLPHFVGADVIVSGDVTDTEGHPVAGANITFLDERASNEVFDGSTDRRGSYRIRLSGSPGTSRVYTVSVAGRDIWTLIQAHIRVSGDTTCRFVVHRIPPPTEISTPTGPMVFVPAGEFIMGSDNGPPNERPAHKVYVDAFYIDKYEVTNAQYKAFCDVTKRKYPPDPGWGEEYTNYLTSKPDYPVVNVTWLDAEAYAKWAKKRLPTEAEWEKAARGIDGRVYPWGNVWNGFFLNHGIEAAPFSDKTDGYQLTAPVGTYSVGSSPYGAMDMAGNVAEWVAGRYDLAYYGRSPVRNPKGPEDGSMRVIRGGAWYRGGKWMTYRAWDDPRATAYFIGFRCAK